MNGAAGPKLKYTGPDTAGPTMRPALLEALQAGRIAGAALDCVWEEPLPAGSVLWGAPNVMITPHTAGETRRYEDNVIDLLLENLGRLRRGESALKNQFV